MAVSTSTRRALAPYIALCLIVLVTLSVMVQAQYQPLLDLDQAFGDGPFSWTVANPFAADTLRVVSWLTATVPMTVYTAIVAVALFVQSHRRAAYWAVGVMLGASLTTYFLKRLFQRDRPQFEDPILTLDSFSFPSGHSSGIASGMGVAIVLTLLLVRRRRLRRALIGVELFVVLLVGADRILLGVHNVSDVVAGYSVGALWVLVGLVAYNPAPQARQREQFANPVPTTRQLAVVLNPIKVESVREFKTLVNKMAAESGWSEPDWYETTIEDPGHSMAEQAAIGGADLVLVCGGDGTVRTVCAELAGTGVPVGVVPAGTGNLLARNLGIPLYLQAAIDVALNGQDRAIDLVAVTGDGIGPDEHFMVMAGMGFDAAVMEAATDRIKARLGWLAYVVAGARQLRYPAMRVEISVDEGPFTKHRARSVVIGNVGYLTAGVPLLPDATIDDGVLDVVLVAPRRFLSWLPVVVRLLSRGKRVDDSLNRMTGRTVVVRVAHARPRQLDGDPVGAGKEIRAECIHGKLLVRVPR